MSSATLSSVQICGAILNPEFQHILTDLELHVLLSGKVLSISVHRLQDGTGALTREIIKTLEQMCRCVLHFSTCSTCVKHPPTVGVSATQRLVGRKTQHFGRLIKISKGKK